MSKNKLLTILLSTVMVFGVTAVVTACTPAGGNSSIVSGTKAMATIKFDLNLEGYETNAVKDKQVAIGKRVPIAKAYITSDNPSNLQLYGWYTDKACTEVWDFKKDYVEGDMTLYAKWVEQHNVSYYINGEFLKSEFAFKGDKLVEDASVVAGFKYFGTYLDEAYSTAFEYNNPVDGDLNLYIKRSEGIYMSDYVEEGALSSASLSDYLVAYIGSPSYDSKGNMIESEGWVEPYTVATTYGDKTIQEDCTYVNFGYAPTWGDPYVELCLTLDITQSQVIRVWFKNLGPAEEVNMYFTALLDAEKNIYSETGAAYTQDFCYPNYTGSGVGAGIALSEDQIRMDKTDEWTYVDFNLHEVHKYGYSIWGTAKYLGMLRFQVKYQNVGEDDWSNEFLIKAIEGIPEEIVVEDSAEVKTLLEDAANTSPDALNNASNAQAANPQGLVFPKDFASYQSCLDGSQVYNTTEGLLFYTENEVVGREKGSPYYGFTLSIPEDKAIDLSELTTLSVTLRNYGYADTILVNIYNDIGIPVAAELKIGSSMQEAKTYTANLYGKFGMSGTLSKIEIQYNALGVDNAILIENIQMSEFVPYDIVGLNFNDKYCFGIESTDKVEVSFDSNRNGTLFNVSHSGASVTSSDRPYKATSDGYGYATLQYYLHKDSNVSAVAVEYKIDGKFTSKYVYQLDVKNKATVNYVQLPLKSDERGFVQAVRFTFEGTGQVLVKSIDYSVNETSLPYYQSYQEVYTGWDWDLTNTYQYDNILKASILIKDTTQKNMSFSLYIGLLAAMNNPNIPHTTKNVLVTETTKVKIVYQNRTDTNQLTFIGGFSETDIGNPDTEGLPSLEANNCLIDCMMAEYEWSTLTVEVPTSHVGKYLGKVTIQFAGKEIAIRAISIETGV